MKNPAVLLLLTIVLTGCAAQHETRDAQRFRGWVARLASPQMEGRGAGTAGLDRARDLLVEAFGGWGLQPGFADGSYTQPLTIPLTTAATRAELAWRVDGREHELKAGAAYDFSVLGFSGAGGFAGEAVFVGYAITDPQRGYDSLAGRADAVRGRAAIALRYEPMDEEGKSRWSEGGRWTDAADLRNKAAWAQRHGATALVIVNPPRKEPGGALLSTQRTAFGEPMGIPVVQLRGDTLRAMLEARGHDAEQTLRFWQDAADEGRQQPEVLAGLRLVGAAAVEHRDTTIHNVCAILPGRGAIADEAVVVGAHYDHLGYGEVGSTSGERAIHPGADDNASGVAAMMMLAERWKWSPWFDRDQRTLVFVAFSGEERGVQGSAHFVAHPDELAFDLKRTVAMINFDMVGRMTDHRLIVMGAGTGDRWPALIAAANAQTRLDLTVSLQPSGMTDHVHFHAQHIAALHLFTGLHEGYHRPTDAAWKINARGGATVVDFTYELLKQLATGEALRFVPEPDGGYTSPP